LRSLGGGTQRAEEEIERTFAAHGIERDKTLVRVDSDSMRGPGKYHSTLARFASGEIRMLVGTQMIAKGLDFPGVRLVGVIDADTAASMPDFRAGERTFQLVSQVAGRAGRGSVAGRVVVQTMNPSSNAIRRAAAHDYIAFAADELKARRQFGFPPITRMARIVCRDRVYARAMESARELAETLGVVAGSKAKVQGPLECAISRIAGYYRFEVLITASNAVELQGLLGLLRRRGQLKSDSKTAVDVDPVSAM